MNSSRPRTNSASGARACLFCRNRKIKCDCTKPECGSCAKHGRQCVYTHDPPRQRPSRALINAAKQDKRELEAVVAALKGANAEERDQLLAGIEVNASGVSIPSRIKERCPSIDIPSPAQATPRSSSTGNAQGQTAHETDPSTSDDEEYDVSTFLAVDEAGKVRFYGPSSALHAGSPQSVDTPAPKRSGDDDVYSAQLIANAALSRQKEHQLRQLQTIGGIPSELALHLLNLHWNRAHHTFLLTYRPAIMRDILHGGPYCSEFLLNAIFAITSKYSDRLEVLGDPRDPSSAGSMFFDRCEHLISRDDLLRQSSIPTIIGLVILGGTFNATGQSSRGWLYTGYALRMVYDLGLHLDSKHVAGNAEDLEIRRRVFWGAFVCDKLQSLYFGRPVTIQLNDALVSRHFLDTYEEMELWQPYVDPVTQGMPGAAIQSTPLYSVSTFQQLCSLSRIMTMIMNKIYRVGATSESARPHLANIDESLTKWYHSLPRELKYEPWKSSGNAIGRAAPNVVVLLTTFNACTILLHRPFISSGHLKATKIPANSWKRCNTAARNITSLTTAYREQYGLRRASYLLAYAVYVAGTIHARGPSAATVPGSKELQSSLLAASLTYLDEMTVHNPGVSSHTRVIRRLMETNNIPEASSQPALEESESLPAEFDLTNFTWPDSTVTPGFMPDLDGMNSFPTFETSTEDMDLLFGFMDSSWQQQMPPT